jgi:hypothetical protein
MDGIYLFIHYASALQYEKGTGQKAQVTCARQKIKIDRRISYKTAEFGSVLSQFKMLGIEFKYANPTKSYFSSTFSSPTTGPGEDVFEVEYWQ